MTDVSKAHEGDAAILLERLMDRGFVVRGEGDQLFVEPRPRLTTADAAAIRAHKAGVLSLLDQGDRWPDLVLTLRVRSATIPPAVRVRKALKALLRAYGLRCLEIRDAKYGDPVEEAPPSPMPVSGS